MPISADPNTAKRWEVFLASFIGGCFLTLADILFNESDSVTTRIAAFFGERVSAGFDSVWFETVAFLVLITLGLGLCFVFKPRSRPSAFVQGSSVIGVLVGMNIGAQYVTAAGSQELTVDGSVSYTIQEPRAFGPFGVGTWLTGESNANPRTRSIQRPVALECVEQKTVGDEAFCAVRAEVAATEFGVNVPEDVTLVWIRRDLVN